MEFICQSRDSLYFSFQYFHLKEKIIFYLHKAVVCLFYFNFSFFDKNKKKESLKVWTT